MCVLAYRSHCRCRCRVVILSRVCCTSFVALSNHLETCSLSNDLCIVYKCMCLYGMKCQAKKKTKGISWATFGATHKKQHWVQLEERCELEKNSCKKQKQKQPIECLIACACEENEWNYSLDGNGNGNSKGKEWRCRKSSKYFEKKNREELYIKIKAGKKSQELYSVILKANGI